VSEAPVVLSKDAEQAITEIFVSTSAIALLYILRQTQHEVSHWTSAGGGPSIAGELTVKEELSCQARVARIEIIHDVVERLKSAVEYVAAMGPGCRVFKLPRGVVERLHQVVVANGSREYS